jgi:hypothetical protein
MRNTFDQYQQPENRLTHALYCTLRHEPKLIVPFLQWIGVNLPARGKAIEIVEQQIPGTPTRGDEGEGEGLPDLCFYTQDGKWIVVFEMKVQAKLTRKQLARHRATVQRAGFETPQMVAITVESSVNTVPAEAIALRWRDIYSWFANQRTYWSRELVTYMEVFEAKAIAAEYKVRGTITMFNGLRFDDETPYTYPAAKRLLRLMGDELQKRPDLQKELGIDPQGARRPAITEGTGVWDFIPLKAARGSTFISFPHLTLDIHPHFTTAAMTVPNGIAGGFRTKLKAAGFDGFLELIRRIAKKLRPVIKRSTGSKPMMYALQRHYASQRSAPVIDGRIEIDLRTCLPTGGEGVKRQLEWAEALYQVLINKRSNIQFAVLMKFEFGCPIVRSPTAMDLFAKSWIAMKPLLHFALSNG